MSFRPQGRWCRLFVFFIAALAVTMVGATAQATETTTYVLTDAQGTVLAREDAHGTTIATYDYRPYGKQQTGTVTAGPGYTGHVGDADTRLVYMQARYYDPDLGRFLSVDPVAPTAGNTDDFNRYAYAVNNPVAYTDPDGRCVDGLTCDSMALSYAQHPEALKPLRPVALAGLGTMVTASGLGAVVEVVTAIRIVREVSSEPVSEAKSVAGIKIGETPSTARQSLTEAGHPGEPITNPQGTETGTLHSFPDKKMDVRVMDGNARNSARVVTTRTGNGKQLVDPNTGKNFGNISKADQRAQGHILLKRDEQ